MSFDQLALPGILGEVREFLGGLTKELPELFPGARPLGRRALWAGRELEVRWRASDERRTRVERAEGAIVVVRGADGVKPREALREHYAEQARKIFSERVAFWAGRMGLSARVRRIFIKDQRTVWGSCSAAGNLNFNWRVIQAPPEVLDYLVIHELAHLIEMNHSKRFWTHVSQHCAAYKAHRKYLRLESPRLKRM